MKFRQAVARTPGLQSAYRCGLQAVRTRDRRRITGRDGAKLTGSVNIDATLKKTLPNSPRWDYAIGMIVDSKRDRIVWVEVHPASSSDVKTVLAKLRWLKSWLDSAAGMLARMDRRIVWVASGTVAIRRGSPQERQLATEGLKFPRSHVVLEDVWDH